MSNTIDLVKAAQDRQYINFEDMALKMLKSKVQSNPIMLNKLEKLNVAQGITEAEESDYDKFFDKKLKKFNVDSPSDLSKEQKKKFFDEIEKEWEGENE